MAKPHDLTTHNDEIITLYQSGISASDIARKFSVCPAAIRYVIKRNNIALRGRRPFILEGKEKELADMYNSGKPISAIAKCYNVSQMTTWHCLKRAGVECRDPSHRQRRYHVNENYFDEINSEEKAYYLGYLYADGNNFTKRNVVSMQLQQRDISVLEGLKQVLQYEGPITFQERKTAIGNISYQCKLSIKNKRLSESLERWGMVSWKTYDLYFPKWFPDCLMNHFIRGFMDGDGWITYSRVRNTQAYQCHIGFIGFVRFIEALGEYLGGRLNIKINQRVAKKGGHPDIYKMATHTRQDAIILGQFLYEGATLFLQRKRDKFNEILSIDRQYKLNPYGENRLSASSALIINNLLNEGEKVGVIVKTLNVSPDLVHSIKKGKTWSKLTEKEKHITKRMLTTSDLKSINELLASGISLRIIANQFCVSKSTISNYKNKRYRTLELR